MAQQNTACVGVNAGNFVRNSASCQSYYYCDGRNAWTGDCPPNHHFNARLQVCDHSQNVDCTECSPWGVQHIPNPTNCNGYYRCSNGQKSQMACPSNWLFDLDTGVCSANGKNGGCISQTTSICTGHSAVTVGDASDCTQ